MTQPLSRKGDTNQAGGRIERGAENVLCNGKQVGLHVSPISPHNPRRKSAHKRAVTTSASPDVICEGSNVLRVTSGNSCGHSIVEGSEDVIVS
jgi:uncharacterized Zn-binding protein involved in type VI secretion